MSGRDTGTGGVLESMVLPALQKGGYSYSKQVHVGARPGGGKHKVDVVAQKGAKEFLISLKWQQVGGTAEQKVPFEVICLLEAVTEGKGRYDKAYVVLGGSGWTLRNFYINKGLEKHIKCGGLVQVVGLEDFVAIANKGKL